MKNGFVSKVADKGIVRVFAYNSTWDARTNMKPRQKWRKSFAQHVYMHNSKPADGAISPIFQNWVTFSDHTIVYCMHVNQLVIYVHVHVVIADS